MATKASWRHGALYAAAVALVEALNADYGVWDLTSAVVAAQAELETALRELGWGEPKERSGFRVGEHVMVMGPCDGAWPGTVVGFALSGEICVRDDISYAVETLPIKLLRRSEPEEASCQEATSE